MDIIIKDIKTYNEKQFDIKILKDIIQNIQYMDTETIASGIGDILLTKLVSHSEQIIYYNIYHLIDWKPKPDCYINIIFNYILLKKLFGKNVIFFYNPNIKIKNIFNHSNLSYIQTYDLIKYFNIKNIDYKDYIVFHTKVRFGRGANSTIDKYKTILAEFFKNFKCNKKIVLLGEQLIATNKETNFIPMTTLYEEYLLLKNNNIVIDLTEKYMYNTPIMDKFEKDLSIIVNADCNIGIGHGGQFCINLCFSKYSIYYVEHGLIDFKINNSGMILIENIYNFIDTIYNNFKFKE